MKTFGSIFKLIILLNFTSCAGLLANRTYIDEMDRESDSFWVAGEDFRLTAGDSGRAYRSEREILERTPVDGLTKEEIQEKSFLRKEITRKVNALSDEDYTQYAGVRDSLTSDSEKVYYLNLPRQERDEYIRTKFFSAYQENSRSPASQNFGYMRSSVTTKVDIGMRKSDIKRIWGRPMQVDVAGDPRYENERWSFYDGSKLRQIYFENGVVSGWILE
ncbi:hypothetical protein BIY24_02435 [Halobacteriovorax marinus]|uniref:hypothetical protein n=1 Tax=Halobacteriovorax marinus TaxID=97084 RepID=UPI000BC3481A|nr:hypothetical protein [Halobacteriovorax marinus]ATH06834.1 hypothetical protein BIY24_02435 [Halobacteriovorax marinus]